MNLSLYDISVEGLQIADLLTENEGELTPEIEARIDALMQAGPDKMEACAMVLRTIEANTLACKNEAARLAERAQGFENNAKHLKERMTFALDAAFSGKLKTSRFTLWTQKSADTVAFDLREEFTLEMLRQDCPELVKVNLELDKSACKRMREEGSTLPEAIFVEENEGKRYLRIK
jgi:hypothetical protein